jgi:hypothetical protein
MKSSTILPLVGVAVVMLVIGMALGSVFLPVTKTVTTTATSTTIIPCSKNYPNGTAPPDVPSIYIKQGATAYLCVRYYYYNSTSTMSLNASSMFGIAGYRTFNSSYSNGFDASPNFTISVSPEELILGGSQNLNEGAFVLYSIHANSNSSGTYNYGFQTTIYPSFETCNGLSEIIVGNGSPNYNVGFGSCTAGLTNNHSVNSEGFISGILTVEVVGITNSSS